MNKNILMTIKKELRATLREKKSLLIMIATPLIIPIFIVLLSFVYEGMIIEDNKEEVFYNVGINYKLNDIEKEILKSTKLKIENYKSKEDLEEAYKEDKIVAYVVFDNKKYQIYSNNMNEDSSIATSTITMYLDTYNKILANNYLNEINADSTRVYNNVEYSFNTLKGANTLSNQLLTTSFMLAMMFITLTAIYTSTDSTAGEKERGTLETLLTFPIKSDELITGKYIAVSISCFMTSILNIILIIISMLFVKDMFEIYKDTIFNINIISISIVLSIMFLYSLFISGLTIAIASLSKTFKEAQSALTPTSFLTMIPMFLDMFGITMTPILSLIPVLNHMFLIKDVFLGNINYINILVMFISTLIFTYLLLRHISKQYKSEKILFSI